MMGDAPDVDLPEEHIPVVSPEMGEATELQRELTPRLDEEDERALASRIEYDFDSAIADRADWEQRIAEWDDAYYGRLPDKSFPWPGCSNFNVPLVMTAIETLKPRLIDGVLGENPPIRAIPTKAAYEEQR